MRFISCFKITLSLSLIIEFVYVSLMSKFHVNELPNVSTANMPLFMRFYIIYKYVSIINIESAISIVSTPTK